MLEYTVIQYTPMVPSTHLISLVCLRFRLRVMEEHLGRQSPLLSQPHSEECLAWIRQVCRDNWEVRLSDSDQHLALHNESTIL